MTPLARYWLADLLFWWWGFWRWRPKIYAHNSDMKRADAYARAVRQTYARILKDAPRRRAHHRDLLTGHAVALVTGLVTRRAEKRPGPHLKKRVRGVPGPVVGRPSVYEYRVEPKNPFGGAPVRISRIGEISWDGGDANVYAVPTRAARRHNGWVKERPSDNA